MNVLDLFSGIGGFSLGLERATFHTVAFCEVEPYARSVLAKHWPNIPCHPDIRQLEGRQIAGSVEVVCGGFPCQDISEAGKRKGIDGERSGLWKDFARIISEVRPRWAIIENSPKLRANGLGRVLSDLAAIGYDAEWSIVSACSLGFPHVRKRMFIVAYPQGRWRQQRRRIELAQSSDQTRDIHQRFKEPGPPGVAHGVTNRTHRNRGIGNAVVPQIAQLIGEAIMKAEAA